MLARMLGGDEPSRPAQPVVEENFNIFDDEEEAESEDDVSDLGTGGEKDGVLFDGTYDLTFRKLLLTPPHTPCNLLDEIY